MKNIRPIYYPNTEALIDSIQKVVRKQSVVSSSTYPLKTFALLLGGGSACQKVDGIDHHMGFETLFVAKKNRQKKQIRKYLHTYYQVDDLPSLQQCCKRLFSGNEDYIQFLSMLTDAPLLDVTKLSQEQFDRVQRLFNYAKIFYPVVKEKGFYAFDVNEQIGLYRIAYACSLIDEEAFWSHVMRLTQRVLSMFDSWQEYALSYLCGVLYFNFRLELTDEHVKEAFALHRDLVSDLLSEKGAWGHGWYKQPTKNFAIDQKDIKPLLQDWYGADACLASDRILVDGCKVGYMYRVQPEKSWDSGWRFMAGDETQDYLHQKGNVGIYKLNTLCNYDQDILPFLSDEYGSAYARKEDDLFHKLSD